MNGNGARLRERVLWVAIVSVLATSMTWLAALAAVATVHFHAPAVAPAFALLHAIGRVALLLISHALPLLLLALVGAMILTLVIGRLSTTSRRTRHA